MALAPRLPSLQVPLMAKTTTEGGLPTRPYAGFFQDIADRLDGVHKGVVDGTDATAGDIGEVLTATAGPVSLTNGVAANIASVSLTPGDWDVSGSMVLSASGGTPNGFGTGISGIDVFIAATFPAGTVVQQLATAVRRENVTVATTVWIVALGIFSGSMVATGTIRARRVR